MKAFTLLTLLAGLALASPVPDDDHDGRRNGKHGKHGNHGDDDDDDDRENLRPGRSYSITNVAVPSILIDLSAGEPTGPVIGYNKNDGSNQKWIVVPLGPGGEFGFRNVQGDSWLAAPSDGGDQLSGSTESPFQTDSVRWRIESQGDDTYVIRSTSDTDKVVDLSGGSSEPLTPIILWPSNGGDNQKWKFVAEDSD